MSEKISSMSSWRWFWQRNDGNKENNKEEAKSSLNELKTINNKKQFKEFNRNLPKADRDMFQLDDYERKMLNNDYNR